MGSKISSDFCARSANVTDEASRKRGRRRFLARTGGALLYGLAAGAAEPPLARDEIRETPARGADPRGNVRAVKLFLCGDVMTGRGIDQILPHPSDPRLFETYVKSAREYVEIAEQASGPIPRAVDPAYIWGDALAELDDAQPDVRIVNLETAVTTARDAWPGKGIHYRMHPANVACLSVARITCCALANNHVLDWGYDGLQETIATLRAAGIHTAGAGSDETEANAPAAIELPRGQRVLVLAYGSPSSGVPSAWAARGRRPGVSVIDEFESGAVERITRVVRATRLAGDLVVVSIHWGSNWGYGVPREQQQLAHRLIDEAGVDLVHGHSSHHPRPIEVYRGKLILHGCGDFLNDYEGIGGNELFRPELAVIYLPELDPASGRLLRLTLLPTRMRRFRVNRASAEEAGWLQQMLNREGRAFGTRVESNAGGALALRWD